MISSGSVLDFERQSCDESGQDPDGEGAAGADTDIRGRHRGKKETQPGHLQPRQGVCGNQISRGNTLFPCPILLSVCTSIASYRNVTRHWFSTNDIRGVCFPLRYCCQWIVDGRFALCRNVDLPRTIFVEFVSPSDI